MNTTAFDSRVASAGSRWNGNSRRGTPGYNSIIDKGPPLREVYASNQSYESSVSRRTQVASAVGFVDLERGWVESFPQIHILVQIVDYMESVNLANEDTQSWHIVDRPENSLDQTPAGSWNHLQRGSAPLGYAIVSAEPRGKRSTCLQQQRDSQSRSPRCADQLDGLADNLVPIPASLDPSNSSTEDFISELGAWTECDDFQDLSTLDNFKNSFVTRDQQMRRQQNNEILSSGSGQQGDSDTFLQEQSQNLPYPGLSCDGTDFLFRAETPLNSGPENVLPVWIHDFMDDYDVSGTRTGYTQISYAEETPEMAGWWPSISSNNEALLLNEAFAQPYIFDCGHPGALEYGTSSNAFGVHGVVGQPNASMTLDLLYSKTGSIFTTIAEGNEISAASDQISDLEQASIAGFPPTSDAASQPEMASASIIDAGEHEELATLPQLQPKANTHHKSPLNIILDNGLGDLRTGEGLKKLPNGRRGPLSIDRAIRIAKTRREKTVCLPCRTKKVAVSRPIIQINCYKLIGGSVPAEPHATDVRMSLK